MKPAGQPRQPPQGVPSLPGETTPAPSSASVPLGRPAGTSSSLLPLSHRLTPRDLHLARLLAEHRTLTTAQITAQLFTHPGTARNRLRQLREIGFLDRFTHRTPDGTRVTCWVPGLLAARYTALADDHPPPTPRAVRARQDRILANPQLDHLLGVNQFFTDLAHHARTHPGTRLIRWWSAERTANAHAGRIHPDGHGIWSARRHDALTAIAGAGQAAVQGVRETHPLSEAPGAETWTTVGFWLEHDTGSMPLARLEAKLQAYRALQRAGGPCCPILFWLPNPRRETHLHGLLATTPPDRELTLATGVHVRGEGNPARAVWWIAGPSLPSQAQTGRVHLTDLAARSRLGTWTEAAVEEQTW
jgi:DNA-binding CsgD family transcriptional regulator